MNPALGQYVDGSSAETAPTNLDAARVLAQGHPKCAVPPPHRPGMALDKGTERGPENTRPGIGVAGALPIGAFQS